MNLTGNDYNMSSQVIVKLSISSPEAHPKRAKKRRKRRRNPKQTNRQEQEREKGWSGLNI
ncbi:MAG: hypothetical protein Q7J27_12290 [Syntrophales bacterium]|nr:hypothetical protein [Syntrophales bacterium]